MTPRQTNALYKAKDKIKELRELLDGVMYYSDPLPENEFKKVRTAYDLICQANDKLP